MNVLSLFDGISCGRVALERAGVPVTKYYASEVDKYAIKVALKNYPDTIQLGDVKNVWARNLPRIDLLMGGSPCQDLSIAKAGRKMTIEFFKIKSAECDFCGITRKVITSANDSYICHKCACEINKHARTNWRSQNDKAEV